MKTWDDWSDYEVNKVAVKFLEINFEDMSDFFPEPYLFNEDSQCEFNLCKSWVDMGQIIGDRKISLHWDWEVMNECSAIGSTYVMSSLGFRQINHEYTSKNHLRAAAIVFLMMNGVTTNENQN